MLPGDRLICVFIGQQFVGYQFKEWPLHITIIPWFRLDMSFSKLSKQLQKNYTGSGVFSVTVLDEALFGYKKIKVVNLVTSPELIIIEGQTRRLLHANKAWVVDEADHTRKKFRPHVTVQQGSRLRKGDKFSCDRIYIVTQHVDFKQIDSVVLL